MTKFATPNMKEIHHPPQGTGNASNREIDVKGILMILWVLKESHLEREHKDNDVQSQRMSLQRRVSYAFFYLLPRHHYLMGATLLPEPCNMLAAD
jgi:hypothetical protein